MSDRRGGRGLYEIVAGTLVGYHGLVGVGDLDGAAWTRFLVPVESVEQDGVNGGHCWAAHRLHVFVREVEINNVELYRKNLESTH